jgi:hypothetical protein
MKRNLAAVVMLLVFFMSASVINAQVSSSKTQQGKSTEKQSGVNQQSGMNKQSGVKQQSGVNKQSGMGMSLTNCMDQIAADSTARGQMVSKMLDSMKGDSAGMMQMCRKFMMNPEMRRVMMKMMDRSGMGVRMQGMGSGVRDTGTGINRSGKDLMKGSDHILDTVKVMP